MSKPASDDRFWEAVDQAVEALNWEEAESLLNKALEAGEDPDILDALGDVYVQKGDEEKAKEVRTVKLVFMRSVSLSPELGADKYLQLGSLSSGTEALVHFKRAASLLNEELADAAANLARARGLLLEEEGQDTSSKSELIMEDSDQTDGEIVVFELTQKLIHCLLSTVEIYLTDECYAPEAEAECIRLLDAALQLDPNSIEAQQLMASVRLSQDRPDEAKLAFYTSYNRWKDVEDPTDLPSYTTRVQAAKLAMELQLFQDAVKILELLVLEFDEDIEVWFLLGFANNRLTPPDPEAALEALEQCMEMFTPEDTDETVHQQVTEEIAKANTLLSDMPDDPEENAGDSDMEVA